MPNGQFPLLQQCPLFSNFELQFMPQDFPQMCLARHLFSLCSIDDLPEGATVGTSSLRRQSQLLLKRPDLKFVELRGNVNTRLAKLVWVYLNAVLPWDAMAWQRRFPKISGLGVAAFRCTAKAAYFPKKIPKSRSACAGGDYVIRIFSHFFCIFLKGGLLCSVQRDGQWCRSS